MSAIIVDAEGRVYGQRSSWRRLGFHYPTTAVFGPPRYTMIGQLIPGRNYATRGRPFVFESRAAAERAMRRLRWRYYNQPMAVVAGDGLDAPHAGKEYLRRVIAKMVHERVTREQLLRALDVEGARIASLAEYQP